MARSQEYAILVLLESTAGATQVLRHRREHLRGIAQSFGMNRQMTAIVRTRKMKMKMKTEKRRKKKHDHAPKSLTFGHLAVLLWRCKWE
ncbi:hypothetical protein RSOLAG1IB_10020 [Rhizoctonia solani AG-1 IB]|uniref:Uncharacterized protein n=1 Tax=Thanatephorus cucumeris (strain AG1-IB / isolate 7/3/14) TaxID=1108050 RepID=A0A0B7FYU0_THACB|nr:hypothetical protein RSOLAG1IB_10020 [Rhizoctonia solani AG-1 IB]